MSEYYIYESIAAWFQAPAEEQSRYSVELNTYIIEHPNTSVLLRVQGESMLGAGIYPGDVVIVDKSQSVKHGDIVVAQIDGSYTIKYFYKNNSGQIYLEAWDTLRTQMFPSQELEIFGVVVSLIRKF